MWRFLPMYSSGIVVAAKQLRSERRISDQKGQFGLQLKIAADLDKERQSEFRNLTSVTECRQGGAIILRAGRSGCRSLA